VIGPNGAGKTTMLARSWACCLVRGQHRFLGVDVGDAEVEQLVAAVSPWCPRSRALFGEMSVEDNLLLGAFQRHRMGHRDQSRPWTRSSRFSRA
jgi:branched-chain amino acid transport system ATP-binding protein